MIFNSITFFVFLTIVVTLYYHLAHRWQNRMLLVASYIFYGWWDWRFLTLILISTLTDYFCGLLINKEKIRKTKLKYLWLSLFINISLLGFFKYFNFFIDNLNAVLTVMDIHIDTSTLNIILPVGISFYTFQTMTYTIDIYRGKIKPTNNFIDFALFVSFFPQLVAGPIERASRLLPQIQSKRTFQKDNILRGLQLIFWGLFLKVFVADNLGIIANNVYGNMHSTGQDYIVGTWAFAFQIFGDFAGYTSIARGAARCLGIELMKNFNQPYFAINPSDFWRRWHISLSQWLRDYLYISMGGNRKGTFNTYLNLMLTMLLGGLWHGAAWNFVIWGGYHGSILILHRILKSKINIFNQDNIFILYAKSILMFQLTCLGWVFFRAQSADHILQILHEIFLSAWSWSFDDNTLIRVVFFCFIPFSVMAIQFTKEQIPATQRGNRIARFTQFENVPLSIKNVVYGFLTYLICIYGAKAQSFIYFQF